MENAQHEFLELVGVKNEIDALGNCVGAAFKRNKLYEKDTNQFHRENLRCDLKKELLLIAEPYRTKFVSETEHERNIQKLSNQLTNKHPGILNEGCFKIGTSQKALNLFLKFLWCLGQFPDGLEPVHCPLDGIILIILKEASIYEAWTKLNNMQLYHSRICKICAKAYPLSLSSWELPYWNEKARRKKH